MQGEQQPVSGCCRCSAPPVGLLHTHTHTHTVHTHTQYTHTHTVHTNTHTHCHAGTCTHPTSSEDSVFPVMILSELWLDRFTLSLLHEP